MPIESWRDFTLACGALPLAPRLARYFNVLTPIHWQQLVEAESIQFLADKGLLVSRLLLSMAESFLS
jgi:hypothetical protein